MSRKKYEKSIRKNNGDNGPLLYIYTRTYTIIRI